MMGSYVLTFLVAYGRRKNFHVKAFDSPLWISWVTDSKATGDTIATPHQNFTQCTSWKHKNYYCRLLTRDCGWPNNSKTNTLLYEQCTTHVTHPKVVHQPISNPSNHQSLKNVKKTYFSSQLIFRIRAQEGWLVY